MSRAVTAGPGCASKAPFTPSLSKGILASAGKGRFRRARRRSLRPKFVTAVLTRVRAMPPPYPLNGALEIARNPDLEHTSSILSIQANGVPRPRLGLGRESSPGQSVRPL